MKGFKDFSFFLNTVVFTLILGKVRTEEYPVKVFIFGKYLQIYRGLFSEITGRRLKVDLFSFQSKHNKAGLNKYEKITLQPDHCADKCFHKYPLFFSALLPSSHWISLTFWIPKSICGHFLLRHSSPTSRLSSVKSSESLACKVQAQR